MNNKTGIDFPYGEEVERRNKEESLEAVFEGFRSALVLLRHQRGFAPKKFLNDKIARINAFLLENDLDCVVMGISGGVDSALVLSLMVEASKTPSSPLKKIVALTMPIYGNGTTNQDTTVDKSNELLQPLIDANPGLIEYKKCDLTTAFIEYTKHCHQPNTSAWANGQLASVVRTPMLYYQAAIFQDLGYRSIVVGTTNRDEGSYIGFFGKASDGMVDLQPIADLHKSEVYALARMLKVPESILSAKPKGDVWDGKCDEEMIGAPYWFLELFLMKKEFHDVLWIQMATLNPEESEQAYAWQHNIEVLHEKNLHKYEVGSPAHFIDVLPRKITGGWQ